MKNFFRANGAIFMKIERFIFDGKPDEIQAICENFISMSEYVAPPEPMERLRPVSGSLGDLRRHANNFNEVNRYRHHQLDTLSYYKSDPDKQCVVCIIPRRKIAASIRFSDLGNEQTRVIAMIQKPNDLYDELVYFLMDTGLLQRKKVVPQTRWSEPDDLPITSVEQAIALAQMELPKPFDFDCLEDDGKRLAVALKALVAKREWSTVNIVEVHNTLFARVELPTLKGWLTEIYKKHPDLKQMLKEINCIRR